MVFRVHKSKSDQLHRGGGGGGDEMMISELSSSACPV